MSTAITNIRIFNGDTISQPSTVILTGSLITSISTPPSPLYLKGTTIIDGTSHTLLPGLIDTHIHLHGPENLTQLSKSGITTALDMATVDIPLLTSLRALGAKPGTTEIFSPGPMACAPGSRHSQIPSFPEELLVGNELDAKRFVEERVKEGADYVKIIADEPGFEQGVLDALVNSAKEHGKKSIAHAAHYSAFQHALKAGVDFITHVPLDKPLDPELCSQIAEKGIIVIPTLIMMYGVYTNIRAPSMSYENARISVENLKRAGVRILVGTDANAEPGVPANVPHGVGYFRELELLIEAGLSNVKVLRAATCDAAMAFGFEDRGVIEVGKRADLVMFKGDPILDIGAIRFVERVWCRGAELERD